MNFKNIFIKNGLRNTNIFQQYPAAGAWTGGLRKHVKASEGAHQCSNVSEVEPQSHGNNPAPTPLLFRSSLHLADVWWLLVPLRTGWNEVIQADMLRRRHDFGKKRSIPSQCRVANVPRSWSKFKAKHLNNECKSDAGRIQGSNYEINTRVGSWVKNVAHAQADFWYCRVCQNCIVAVINR